MPENAARAGAWYLRLLCLLGIHRDRQQWLYVSPPLHDEPQWVSLGRVCEQCSRHVGTPEQRRSLQELHNWKAKAEAQDAIYSA